MCGISGLLDPRSSSRDDVAEAATCMADTMKHRGPDDHGLYVDESFPAALSFRRLAIIDLTATGHQPMMSQDGRYAIVFNGEIYNYQALRAALPAAIRWRGSSDTEVLLAALQEWGIEETLRRVDGMFAFALWDSQRRRLSLGRDRFGEKPLYYGWCEGVFLFASELKAMHAHPGFKPTIDRSSLALYLRHDYIPAPWTVFDGIAKLPPGSFLEVDAARPGVLSVPSAYWTAQGAAEAARADPFTGTGPEAVAELEKVLGESIRRRMVADVPLGAFLSGGIDSSLVVSLMQARSTRPVQTFTVGFPDASHDESPWAAAVADHLGTDHTSVPMTSADVLAVVPNLPDMYDEPFADSSQVPTHLVSTVARQHVTVALSGDGGDELFGGYNRYTTLESVWKRLRQVPPTVRPRAAALLAAVPVERWDRGAAVLRPVLPARLRFAQVGDKVHKLASTLQRETAEEVYLDLVSRWREPSVLLPGVHEHPTLLTDPAAGSAAPDLAQRMMLLDTVTYLPDDILAKVDRAAMATSLETRVPMLSPEVFDFAWRLPLERKVAGGRGKVVMRDLLAQHVPRSLVERPKMGFTMPLASWLRGELRPWAEEMLAPDLLAEQGILEPEPIATLLRQHLSGTHDWKDHLWGPLMFQAWWQRWMNP